jgi:NAD dependent epimerase/dehydratase family enzyme
VNSTTPNPVRNAELTDAIAHVLGRRSRLALPATLLRLALGRGAADELLLASQRVLPKKLTDAGYVHAYADLPDALTAALAPRSPLRP